MGVMSNTTASDFSSASETMCKRTCQVQQNVSAPYAVLVCRGCFARLSRNVRPLFADGVVHALLSYLENHVHQNMRLRYRRGDQQWSNGGVAHADTLAAPMSVSRRSTALSTGDALHTVVFRTDRLVL